MASSKLELRLKTASASRILISSLLALLSPLSAFAETSLPDIEKLSNIIVRKELALLKLGNRFLLEQEHFDKYKPWREFAYNTGAATSTHTGIIMQGVNDWRGAKEPKSMSRRLGRTGCSFLLTGGCITIGGAAIETTIDYVRSRKLKRKGMDTKTVLRNFVQMRNDVDSLISQRKEEVHTNYTLTDWQRKMLLAEGAVLEDIRELATMAFVDSFIKIKHGLWQRETAKILAVETAANSNFLGSLNALLAFTDHHPHQAGVAGIGFVLGGTSVMATPFIMKYSGAYGAHRARQFMHKTLGEVKVKSTAQLQADMDQLSTMVKTANPDELQMLTALNTRQSIYEAHQLLLFDEPFIKASEKKREEAQFKERVIFSTLIGGSNIARGALSITAGYRYYDQPKKFNLLGASAATSYTAGTGIWLGDLMQQRTRAVLHERKLKMANSTPEAKLQARLDAIDNMDNAISVF
ncbi:MAG: hypothetical protein K2W82_08245 [Candidatus Obscuribacterales bacterium]|nr:hypothetical protein [Candidatus Obscuribacterales bacterium]